MGKFFSRRRYHIVHSCNGRRGDVPAIFLRDALRVQSNCPSSRPARARVSSTTKQLSERLRVVHEETVKGKRIISYAPTINVEIEFMEWTGRKLLRAPVFKGFTEVQ